MGHAGRHANTPDDRRRSFLWHLSTFAWVMVLLAVIDVIAGNDWWVHWVAAIWGAILAVHFFDAFLLGGFLGFHACGPHSRTNARDQTPEGIQQ